MDANEVKNRLAEQAENVCRHLLPAGKRHGRQWRVGDLSNHEGDSLVIEVEGAKVGVWSDFASSEKGGNLLELWRAVRALDFSTAFRQACEWLGVSSEGYAKTFLRTAARPKQKYAIPAAKFVPLLQSGVVWRYLTAERGISVETLEQYGVAETQERDAYVFPSYAANGKTLEMWKSVALQRTDRGKKITYTSSGTAKTLFGKHAVSGHMGTLVITEGEIDAMSVAEIGGFAVSVPYGAKAENGQGRSSNDEWIEYDWEWLQQFTTIILCFDSDEEGRGAALDVLKRLGRERCRLVKLPEGCKDPNECLVKGLRTELGDAIENARSLDPDELRNAGEYRDAVWDRMHPPGNAPAGLQFFLPIAFRIRPGELTVWSGYNGSGKSVFLTQLAVDLAAKGERTCIGSFEMSPAHTLQIAARQASNLASIDDRDRFNGVMDWLAKSLWIFDRDGLRGWEEMLEVFTYARRRYDVRHFVVDSLAKCGIDSDNYNGQKRFVDELVNWAKREGVHVHLVAHQKKSGSEREHGDKMGVKGASEITDLAFNVATIWRNKDKEEALWAAVNSNDAAAHSQASKMIDGKLSFSKQRETGDEPWTNLFFDRNTLRFRSTPESKDVPYI